MRELTVQLGERSYPIYIGRGLLGSKELYAGLVPDSQLMVVTNTTVEKLYLEKLKAALPGGQVAAHVIPDGEKYKTLASFDDLITELLRHKFDRGSCLIALGGGVIGDLTGFAAACYQRGIRFLQVPTTLLAQVDSSVGGKTAVNHPLGKNMIGAFHQPCGVVADVDVLLTLPDRELSAGLAEVIKYGLIRDKEFFIWLENNMAALVTRDPGTLEEAVERSCRNKAEVVAADEREGGLRAILNLGHTFGHAIETGLNYEQLLHGEAVAIGILMAAEMSRRLGWLEQDDVRRIRALLELAALPVKFPGQARHLDMRELMSVDKKVRGGKLNLVLLKSIGEAVVSNDFEDSALRETLDFFTGGVGG